MRRRGRLVVWAGSAVVGAVATAVAGVAGVVATGGTASWFPTMGEHYLWWLVASSTVVAGSGLLAAWAQQRYEQGLAEVVPTEQRPERWVVDRPVQVQQVVQAVLRREAGTVGITTAVHGAGGFGKSMLARMVRADRRVLRRFDGRVYWVTLGRDLRRDALLTPLNDLLARVDPGRAHAFTDVRQAGEHLAAVLADGPRRLIVLDDVWFDDQLAAFPVAGKCARLVTTRIPSLVAGQAVPVRVDQMSPEQARRVLIVDLPGLPHGLVEELMVETGRWPLLLRLVNRNLLAQTQSNTDLAAVATDLLQQLRRDGPLRAAGHLPEVGDVTQLDVTDPEQRSKAVAATIEASAGLLTADERTRLTELSIFVEDETVPVPLVATLWQATGGLDTAQARMLCNRLADLALLTLTGTGTGGTISVHDVVRDYLRDLLATRVPAVHQALLGAIAADLPRAPARAGSGQVVAWWALPETARYLREHLVEHLVAAQRPTDAEAVATDLRWVQSRLHESGPVGPFADLAHVDTPRAARLGRLLAQTAHLLTPTDPPHSLTDVLYSRIDHDPDWGPQARRLAQRRSYPALRNTWPLPDLPDSATRRVLTGHTGPVNAVAIAPDGTWLATTGRDGTVRIWDPATGTQRATLTGHTGLVSVVAIAPDGTWLATGGGFDARIRIWNPTTGAQQATLRLMGRVSAMAIAPDGTWLAGGGVGMIGIWNSTSGPQQAIFTDNIDEVTAVAIAPDGTWLAAGGDDGTIRIWNPTTGAQQATLTGHTRPVSAVAIAPDGTWLATADGGTVLIWDIATGTQRSTLTSRRDPLDLVRAVAVAPDGTWLASASANGGRTLELWDVATGIQRTTFTGHTEPVNAIAIAPDGTWLASGGDDGTVRIWDVATDTPRTGSTRYTNAVDAVAFAPDGTWLATGGDDERVLIWDATTGAQRTAFPGHTQGVAAVAIAPDGTWLVSAGDRDGKVLLWEVGTGTQRTALTGVIGPVNALAISPDGTWLATGDDDGTVRIWDVATGTERTVLTGHTGAVRTIAIAPDGTWLATGGDHDPRLATFISDRTVKFWDVATGTQRTTLTGHTEPVNAIAIAPDGTWLATGGSGTVLIWDVATGTQRTALAGHTGQVRAVAITPDGTWLATGGDDRTVRIWSLTTRATTALMRVESRLQCCSWHPQRHLLAVGGWEGLYHFDFRRSNS